MSEEDGFLAAVLAAPRDDTPRLAFADWLDERGGPGDAARAEFIRLSVGEPDATFGAPADRVLHPVANRGEILCRDHWREWSEWLRGRLGGSPLRRWLGTADCRWAYRRGFVAVFEGTQQVVLDAWDDLFRLGPVEEVQVNNLWHFGTVSSLVRFLDRPSLRVLRMNASELRADCVNQLNGVADWLMRLDRVELFANNPDPEAAERLTEWLAGTAWLRHVRWRGGGFY
jgi:uncharacterized protein (TIGR02996 family)